MLRISINYVILFLYIENINVVIVVWSMATLVIITHKFKWARDARASSANDYYIDCTSPHVLSRVSPAYIGVRN
jgi:hypothetical protein